jgi:tetratricopeptide (TPR) repeat protein
MSDVGPVILIAQTYEAARERRQQGNTLGAVARYRKAAELAEQRGDHRWAAEILAELGEMHQEAYDLLEARRSYEEALERYTRAGETAAGVHLRLAQVAQLSGDLATAEAGFRAAIQAYGAAGDRSAEGETRLALARLFWEQQRPGDAVEEAVWAWSLGREAGAEALFGEAVELLRAWKRRMKREWLRERLAPTVGLWEMLE